MTGTLLQVNVSNGGMPKRPVLTAHVTSAGIEGDRQRNKKYHGGPDRAVCLYSAELYDEMRSLGAAMSHGDVGENFTTGGFDLSALKPGDRLTVGGAAGCLIEIVDVRIPCSQLKMWHERLPQWIKGRSGWVARVLREGFVKPGDAIDVEQAESHAAE